MQMPDAKAILSVYTVYTTLHVQSEKLSVCGHNFIDQIYMNI